jgi:hypothetical protein
MTGAAEITASTRLATRLKAWHPHGRLLASRVRKGSSQCTSPRPLLPGAILGTVTSLLGIGAGAATLAARGVNQTVDLAVAALDVGP